MDRPTRYGTMAAPGYSGDPRRMTIMVEPMPWLLHGDCAEALMFRGAIVAAWGYVDTTLSELAVRCSKCDDYETLRAAFPSAANRRTAYLKLVLGAPGPLAPYRGIGHLFLDRFAATERTRHMMAHGRMKMTAPHLIEIEEIDTSPGGSLSFRRQKLRLADLEGFARTATKLSRFMHRAVHEIDKRKLLPAAVARP